MLGVLQRAVAPGPETAHSTDQHDCDPLTLIYQRGQPLVDIVDLQYHLDLLGVFHKLHHDVDAAGIVVDPSTKLPIMSAAQGLFLARAQHRFDLWTTNILERQECEAEALRPEELPPVDVLLLLHVYMLNPIAYREDVIRVYPCLARVGPFPWKDIHSLIATSTFEMTGTPAQIRLWESATAEPFEPPITTLASDTVNVTCPRCFSSSKTLWKADKGIGFGEIGFSHVCTQCGLAINSDALCVSKFLTDLSTGRPLAHTALNKDGMEDTESARDVSDEIGEMLGGAAAVNGDRFAWNLSNIEQTLLGDASENDPFHKWLSYVLSAYTHFGKASIDLKAAVLRQGRFIQSMHHILWAGPGSSFPGKEQALMDAVASYERYFALTKTHAHGLVPTLDVDLAFHTHQLAGPTYANDCFNILGHFLNHDDTGSNPETHHDNVMQSIDIWNRVYGESPPLQYTPADGRGPRPGECSNCRAPNGPSPKPCKDTVPADTDNGEFLDLPRGLAGGGPRGYRSPDPPPPRLTDPTRPKPSDGGLTSGNIYAYGGNDNTYERGLPPLYQMRGPGEGPGGGPPHVECSNCDPGAVKPKPQPPKPPRADVNSLDLPRGPGGGGSQGYCSPDNTYERGLPPLYQMRGPGEGPGGGPPHVECHNCDSGKPKPKPPPPKPTRADVNSLNLPRGPGGGGSRGYCSPDNTYERGLPPLYQMHGPGEGPGGGPPHVECGNCDPGVVKPKPKPKPRS